VCNVFNHSLEVLPLGLLTLDKANVDGLGVIDSYLCHDLDVFNPLGNFFIYPFFFLGPTSNKASKIPFASGVSDFEAMSLKRFAGSGFILSFANKYAFGFLGEISVAWPLSLQMQ
jgi:hypothetical protein